MVPDVDLKLIQYTRFWEAKPTLEEALRTGDFYPPYDAYEIVPAYHVGRRAQVDKVWEEKGTLKTKERPVTDWLGNQRPSVKRVLLNAAIEEFTMRTRLVYAFSGTINYGLGAFWSGFKNWMRSFYAFTLEHRDRASMLAKLSRFVTAFSLDVITSIKRSLPSSSSSWSNTPP